MRAFFILFALTVAYTNLAGGAEMQLRANCQAQGTIVRLGDVADVLATDPQESKALAGLELFPAPAPGQQRTLRVRELQDLLAMRRVNLAAHRFSGSSQTVISSAGDQNKADPRPLSPSMVRRAERLVSEAVVRYLQQQVSSKESWNASVSLSESQARAIPMEARDITVRGGARPWVGKQQFELIVGAPAQATRLPVTVEVALRAPVVVVTASLPRGAVIRTADVQVQPDQSGEDRGEACHSLDEVVGRELTRAVAAGVVLQPQYLRTPILVRRGEVVTVYARSGGVRVRITARAKDEGSLGDLITVESLLNRKPYTARVSGIQEAEVYARALQAAPAAVENAPAGPANAFARDNERN
jgi:flagella basal body P-ring formation protein FlgA